MHNLLANKRPLCTFNEVTESRRHSYAKGWLLSLLLLEGLMPVHAASIIVAVTGEPRLFNLSLHFLRVSI